MPSYRAIVVTDGGARRPNPQAPWIAAIGFGIYDEQMNPLDERSHDIGNYTNNQAEYYALIEALDVAMEHCRGVLLHYSDSNLAVQQLNRNWRVRKPHLKPLVEQVLQKQLLFERVEHIYIPRSDPRIVKIDSLVDQVFTRMGL